jgi:hypothetical protein
MIGVGHGLLWSDSTVGAPVEAASSSSGVPTFPDSEGEIATFHFDGSVECSFSRGLPFAERDIFKADFRREFASVRKWLAKDHWSATAVSNLQVFVSDEYRISKSLVPAWYGHSGHMEFPARRVIARKAAIAHELIHVFLPNGNRLLAEGLAVELQARIGGNPAFPNFGRSLHEMARDRLCKMVPEFTPGDPKNLDNIHLADLDEIATPSPLTLRVGQDFLGEEPRGQAVLYSIAGSFVRFLIETHGLEKFRALYLRTPLVALERNPGSPNRWIDVYALSLADLEFEWKSLMAGGGFPTGDESDRGRGRTES